MVACGSLLGVILISLAEAYGPALEEWVSQDPRSRLRPTAAAFFVAIAAPILGFAGYFWRIGGRVIRAERFPAPAAAVFRDTVVLRGRSARRRGRVMQLCAAILILAAAGFGIFLWRLVSLLTPGAA